MKDGDWEVFCGVFDANINGFLVKMRAEYRASNVCWKRVGAGEYVVDSFDDFSLNKVFKNPETSLDREKAVLAFGQDDVTANEYLQSIEWKARPHKDETLYEMDAYQ